MSDSWIDVALASRVTPGEYEIVDTDEQVIAVINVAGEFFAIEDVCTHDGEELTGGPIEDDQIVCPRHGAKFCVRTGAALTAPAYEPVRTFPVRVRDGMIQVSVG